MRPALLPLLLCSLAPLGGCAALAGLFGEDEPNCEPRRAYYPDTDADGVGDEGAIYVGCAAPEGYVETPPPDAPVPEDSGAADTAPADTAAP